MRACLCHQIIDLKLWIEKKVAFKLRHKLIALCTLHKDNFCPRASFHIHFMWEEKHLWYDLSHIQSMLFLFYRKIIIIIFCKSIVDHLRCTKALTHIHIPERTQSVGFWMCSIEFRPIQSMIRLIWTCDTFHLFNATAFKYSYQSIAVQSGLRSQEKWKEAICWRCVPYACYETN